MTPTVSHYNEITSTQLNDLHDMPSWVNKVPYEICALVAERLDARDIKSFLLTCRRMSMMMKDELLRHDIKRRTYNALSWACFFGDSSLARDCLSLGASPNATFWSFGSYDREVASRTQQSLTYHHEGRMFSYETIVFQKHDHPELEFPVYPTKQLYQRHLLQTIFPFSALGLATLRNNLSVMQVLLEFGARQFDHRSKVNTNLTPWSSMRREGYPDLEHPHQVALSHVRSVEAAKLLLDAGGAVFINNCGDSPFSPLEMVLSRFQQRDLRPRQSSFQPEIQYPMLKMKLQYPISELELKHLIKVLLMSGASPRRPPNRVLSPAHKKDACDGPLEAAITTMLPSLVKLIFQHGSADPAHPENSEFLDIMRLALPETGPPEVRPDLGGGNQNHNPFGRRLLRVLNEAGFPIAHRLAGCLPLPIVVYANLRSRSNAIETLIRAGASPDEADPGQLCPLSQAVASSVLSYGSSLEGLPIKLLLNKGAKIDNPAFCSKGFTPLFLATADLAPADIFSFLLEKQATWKGIQCQPAPGKPFFTLLQCLFLGLPPFTRSDTFRWPVNLTQSDIDIVMDTKRLRYIRKQRNAKFAELRKKRNGLLSDSMHFYTADNRHIVHWAIDNLDGFRRQDAISKLLPLYSTTKREDDRHPILWTLFNQKERQGYLSIGTLDQTASIVKSVVEPGHTCLQYVNITGETFLHLVCKMFMHIPDEQSFRRFRASHGRYPDFGTDFLKLVRDTWDGRGDRPKTLFPAHVTLSDIHANHAAYLKSRRQSIANILNHLLALAPRNSLYRRDRNGNTPHGYARQINILDLVDIEHRDQAMETAQGSQ